MRPWSVEECEAYAKQLRDKSRASTAEHAAQAIDYLLGLVRRDWQGLTDEEIVRICAECWRITPNDIFYARAIEAKLKERNA